MLDGLVSDDPVTALTGTNLSKAQSAKDESLEIVNGQDVKPANQIYKYAVLLTVVRNGKTTSCTAVPITHSILLTAAHCVHGVNPSAVKVIFDSTQVNAQAMRVHAEFDGSPQSKADLALIKLRDQLAFGYKPMSLYDGLSARDTDDLVMLGFGITDEKKSDALTLRTTSKSYKNDVYIKDGLIGFNQKNKTGGFCRGDSGAPIFVTSGKQVKLIGINSFTVGTEPDRECHTASFAMYIPHFRSWILSQAMSL